MLLNNKVAVVTAKGAIGGAVAEHSPPREPTCMSPGHLRGIRRRGRRRTSVGGGGKAEAAQVDALDERAIDALQLGDRRRDEVASGPGRMGSVPVDALDRRDRPAFPTSHEPQPRTAGVRFHPIEVMHPSPHSGAMGTFITRYPRKGTPPWLTPTPPYSTSSPR